MLKIEKDIKRNSVTLLIYFSKLVEGFLAISILKTSKKATSPAYTNRPLRGEDKTATIDPTTKPVKTIWMRRAKGFLCCLAKAIPVPYFDTISISNFIHKIQQNNENSYVF